MDWSRRKGDGRLIDGFRAQLRTPGAPWTGRTSSSLDTTLPFSSALVVFDVAVFLVFLVWSGGVACVVVDLMWLTFRVALPRAHDLVS